MLSIDQIASYHRDGFLAIEDFVTPDACRALRQRADEIVEAFVPSAERTIFTTDEQERTSNREFIDSGSGIWCFFEEEAFGPDGELVQDKALSINKIGHAMHDLDPVFESFSYTPQLAAVAADVGLDDPLALQSMYIFKQPLHRRRGRLPPGRPVPLHRSRHRHRLLVRHRGRDARQRLPVGPARRPPRPAAPRCYQRVDTDDPDGGDGATRFVELDDTPLPEPPAGLVPIVARAGTMVILHGLLPHWSDVNRSPASRHAYSLHCISEAADYPAWNWLQRPPSLPLRRLDRVAQSGQGSLR